jgi:probable DNA repair protein
MAAPSFFSSLVTRHSSPSLQLSLPLTQSIEEPIVLTASRRLAHAMRLARASAAQASGLTVWRTPQILPWSTWLRRQYLEARASASNSEAPMRVLTQAQSKVLWDDIVTSSPFASELLNPANAARAAARSWRRLHEHLIPIDALSAYDTAEARAFHAWCIEFVRRCRSLRAIDEALLTQWAEEVGFIPGERVACAGFDVMPPAMQALTERWRRAGWLVELEATSKRAAQIDVVAAADAAAELQDAARWAREQVLKGTSRIGIILGDVQQRRDEVVRVFEDIFAPGQRQAGQPTAALPVTVAAPAPLAAYPIVDAAMLVLQLASSATSNDAGRLLRSPFIVAGFTERASRALADLRLREEQRERWDWFELERWAHMTGCEQLQLAARKVNELLRQVAGSALASEWAERFQALWLTSGWPGERSLSSIEHQTVEKIQSVLAEFGSLDAVAGRMSLQGALARLRGLLADTPFEPETTTGSVTVIDAATSAGMRFDALWVAGLDADRVPAPVNPDTLIPLELQRQAGVPDATAAGVLRLASIQLQRWITAAPHIVLSWPRREGDAHLQLSPLVTQLGIEPRDAIPATNAANLSQLLFEARPPLESVPDERAPVLAQPARGGARTLELQSICPFRAQAELRLRAQPLPRVSLGVEPLDRGAILHRVLEEIWGALQTHARLISTDERDLERQVRESAQRHAAHALRPDTRHRVRLAALEVESVVRQVMRLLAVEKQRPPFSVQLAEAAETYTLGGLTITLRPDRIDALAEGGALLIDYKLGDSHRPRDWFDVLPGRPRRPQLPLYGLAHAEQLRALAYVVLAPGAVEYRGWSDGAQIGPGVAAYPHGMRIDLGDPADWTALLHHWRFALMRLAERYVAGESKADPLPQACTTCHLSTLCRIHELALSRDEGATIGEANRDD